MSTPPFRAWLKISEGCSRICAYCVIPQIRGPLAPEPMEGLVAEARRLCAGGVLELTLIAQDLTSWRSGGEGLGELVLRLGEIPGLRWLRLMYCHPDGLTSKLLKALRSAPKVLPYLDVPFQHASSRILKAMGRGGKDPFQVVDKIRDIWPEAALRTTLMTGFPGEDDFDFAELVRFLEHARFDHAGFFKFSPEEGAPAAFFPNQVPQSLKDRRRRRLQAVQRRISESLGKARVGSVVEVLAEGPSPDADFIVWGRAAFQAPDVDGIVYFEGPQPAAGEMGEALVTGARGYDLRVRLLGGDSTPPPLGA